MDDSAIKDKAGHRQRLRQRFLAGEDTAMTEESLLELLLTYAIPQKDVQPLARDLLTRFGSLSGVLEAGPEVLCATDGIKEGSAVLIKVVDLIRNNRPAKSTSVSTDRTGTNVGQAPLFATEQTSAEAPTLKRESRVKPTERTKSRRGSGLFGKAILKESIEMLPGLPETDSREEIRAFLQNNLHFNAEQTRRRNADYIVSRMFPSGRPDRALRVFAKRYEGRQELRDVCFYRFCKAERVMYTVIDDLFIPSIGAGRLNRERLCDYLTHHYPDLKSIKDYALAITDALGDSGVAKIDRTRVTFGYREILLPSFAFVIHNEFPEPGIYPIEQLEGSPALRAMLWNPDRLLSSLYELRNQGFLAKVSEIDSVRQFTTKWDLAQVVERLVSASVTA